MTVIILNKYLTSLCINAMDFRLRLYSLEFFGFGYMFNYLQTDVATEFKTKAPSINWCQQLFTT